MGRLALPHPLPADRIPEMMAALAAGGRVEVGQEIFVADEDSTVWGVDPYGCDFIAANCLDAERIVACADRYHDPSMPHQAEFYH